MRRFGFFATLALVLFLAGCGSDTTQSGLVTSVEPPVNEAYVEEEKQDNFVDLSIQEDKPELTLQPVYFDFDKYFITEAMKPVVSNNVQYIKDHVEKGDLHKVLLEGNTDEFGSSEYNFALGLKRAIALRDALILQGVNKDLLDYISYGKTNPVCNEKTPECYANNRRVDLVSTSKDTRSGTLMDKRADH